MEHPSPLCRSWQSHEDEGHDNWELWARHCGPKFIKWVDEKSLRSTSGARFRYAIVNRTPYSGIGWVLLCFVLPLKGDRPQIVTESTGAFYDGAEDHPEGAVEWAVSGAKMHAASIDRIWSETQ